MYSYINVFVVIKTIKITFTPTLDCPWCEAGRGGAEGGGGGGGGGGRGRGPIMEKNNGNPSSPTKVRKLFPETWLWNDETTG